MRKLATSELPRLEIEAFKQATKTPIRIVLDDIRSLHNVGSVFRTSDAFLIDKIYLCGITATPPNKEIHKTALGATETVSWEYVKDIHDLILKLKKENWQVFAVEQVENATFLNYFEPSQPLVLVFGNEVKGVQQSVIEMCDGCLEIPQLGHKHSLNISVSCGIVVWDLFQKLSRK